MDERTRKLLDSLDTAPPIERPEGFHIVFAQMRDEMVRCWPAGKYGSLQSGTPLMELVNIFAEQLAIIKLEPFKSMDMGTFGPLIKEAVSDFVKTDRFYKGVERTIDRVIEDAVEKKMKEYFQKQHEREKELAKAFDLDKL